MTINWTNITVKLGDLQPWPGNPRVSTKRQAERLLQSWSDFGQVQTVAVSPSLKVLDGHQRLSALLTLHGKDYEVDARQSDRELSDVEQRALVLSLHAAATGQWDWDTLSNWDATFLQDFGLDEDYFQQLQTDTAALLNLTASEMEATDPANDPYAEWGGMPEFENEPKAVRTLYIHFRDNGAVEDFVNLINQSVTEKTKSLWYPEKPDNLHMDKTLRYESEI